MDHITKRAYRAYFTRFGATAPQPSEDISGVEHSGIADPHDVVVLRNVRGELACFRVIANGRLRFVGERMKDGQHAEPRGLRVVKGEV